jgi:hypothetical protein
MKKGNNCNVTTCFGILSDNKKVCNSKGNCISKDKCVCSNRDSSGNNCQYSAIAIGLIIGLTVPSG